MMEWHNLEYNDFIIVAHNFIKFYKRNFMRDWDTIIKINVT